jgi:hypothetical protein
MENDPIRRAAELFAMGENALSIAGELGVHVRTVYKWLRRAKPEKRIADPATPIPEGYSRADALADMIDRAIIATSADPTAENVAALGRLCRAAKAIADVPSRYTPDHAGARANLERKLEAMAAAEARRLAEANAQPGESLVARRAREILAEVEAEAQAEADDDDLDPLTPGERAPAG